MYDYIYVCDCRAVSGYQTLCYFSGLLFCLIFYSQQKFDFLRSF